MILESYQRFFFPHVFLFTISAVHFRTSVQRLIYHILFCIPSYQARTYSELTGSLFIPAPVSPHPTYQSRGFLHRAGRTGRRSETNDSGYRCLIFLLFYLLLIYIVYHGFYSTGFFWFSSIIEISRSCTSFILAPMTYSYFLLRMKNHFPFRYPNSKMYIFGLCPSSPGPNQKKSMALFISLHVPSLGQLAAHPISSGQLVLPFLGKYIYVPNNYSARITSDIL